MSDDAYAVLKTLVELKDGPRDEHYRATKDAAWDAAREVLTPTAREQRLAQLLANFVAYEDKICSFDHHGYCQEHGWFGEPGECNVRAAREELGLDEA
jgi:alpha-D-ribose 1-methylphosphonate 5-triphosphate synthase subunit PhnI